MNWRPISSGAWEAENYRIAAVRLEGESIYGLFAPPLPEKIFEGRLKIRYALGELVPQRRALLGHFATPEAARAAAERHRDAPAGLTTN